MMFGFDTAIVQERAWEQAVQKGIRALQTDHPGDLVAWLKEKGLRQPYGNGKLYYLNG